MGTPYEEVYTEQITGGAIVETRFDSTEEIVWNSVNTVSDHPRSPGADPLCRVGCTVPWFPLYQHFPASKLMSSSFLCWSRTLWVSWRCARTACVITAKAVCSSPLSGVMIAASHGGGCCVLLSFPTLCSDDNLMEVICGSLINRHHQAPLLALGSSTKLQLFDLTRSKLSTSVTTRP